MKFEPKPVASAPAPTSGVSSLGGIESEDALDSPWGSSSPGGEDESGAPHSPAVLDPELLLQMFGIDESLVPVAPRTEPAAPQDKQSASSTARAPVGSPPDTRAASKPVHEPTAAAPAQASSDTRAVAEPVHEPAAAAPAQAASTVSSAPIVASPDTRAAAEPVHEPAAAAPAQAASTVSSLGDRIATATRTRHLGDGTFQLPERPASLVDVQRTRRAESRAQRNAERVVLEVPLGLSAPQLEREVISQLDHLRSSGLDALSAAPTTALRARGTDILGRAPRGARPAAARTAGPRPDHVEGVSSSGFEIATELPGAPLAEIRVAVSQLSKELREAIPPGATEARLSLHLDGDALVIALQLDHQRWISRTHGRAVIETIVGSTEGLAQLGDHGSFLRGLRSRVVVTGTRVRIPLWGEPPSASFAVFDLVRAAAGLARGTTAGFRPVEAQILLGKAGGLRVFGGPDVPAAAAIPGAPIGDWFPLPDDGTLRGALGLAGPGQVYGGVFFAGGTLRVAVKPTADAETGIAAHIELAHLLEQLKKLGAQVAKWIERLLARLKAGAVDFLHVLRGLLRFELPELGGSWFEFDLKLQLPRLFRGGGFDLSALWPSGFHIDLGGLSFGGLPKWKLPWLKAPRIGSFSVPWDKLRGLFDGLPSIGLPRLPSFDLGLHWPGGFRLGLGLDLSLAWPDLDLAFGFELDLEKLLARISGVGQWLLAKLRAAANWVSRWIHLGRDGVLRIYDATVPDGPMLGFHLMRLLDGADATDLTPTELRWNPTKKDAFSFQLGEAAPRGGDKPAAGPKDKLTPVKPEGLVMVSRRGIAPPPSLLTAMGLTPGATVDAELVYHDRDRLTVWCEAASQVYDRRQAMRATVNLAHVAQALARLPQAKGIAAGNLGLKVDEAGSSEGPTFVIGESKAASQDAGPAAKGRVGWRFERLLGFDDWTTLVPDRLEFHVDGAGGVQLGKLRPPAPLLHPPGRFELEAPVLRQRLLLAGDALSSVFAGVHLADDVIGVSLTKTPTGNEGALAQIHLSFLLRQLERLGQLGRSLLEKLASIALPQSSGHSDVLGRLAELARALRTKFLKLVDGLLSIEFPGGFLRWNLRAQLPHLGLDFDLAKLVPDFHFDLPALPELSFQFQLSGAFGNPFAGFRIPIDGLRKYLGGIPGLDIGKLVPQVDVAWIGDLLSISLRLGNLFGDGERSFGFHVPVSALLDKLRRAGRWVGGKVASLHEHVHIGSDGVLRVFDPQRPEGNRVGFDLKRLFDGVSPSDLVPSELHAELPSGTGGPLAALSIGDAHVTAQDQADEAKANAERKHHGTKWGKVLVPRPRGEQIATAALPAPAALRDQLGIPENAPGDATQIHAGLYLTREAAVVHATVDRSDRGLSLTVQLAALERLLAGTFGAGAANAEHKGLRLDRTASRARGMLVVSFGDPKRADHSHGYAAWRIPRLLEDPSLSSVVPDEVKLSRKEGSLRAGRAIDVSRLRSQGTVDLGGWELARSALGGHDQAEVFTNDLRADARIALVAVEEGEPHRERLGLELTLNKDFLAQLRRHARELAARAGSAVSRALSKTDRAGEIDTKFSIRASTSGISLERGEATAPDHMYARYGWHRLAELFGGELDASSLVPDEFRLATRTMAVEVKNLDVGTETLPANSHQIGTLHPILRDALVGCGLSPDQWIDLARSPITHHDEQRGRLGATGHIYDVAGTGDRAALAVTGGKQVTIELDVRALIAQVLPRKEHGNEPNRGGAERRRWSARVAMTPTADLNHDGQAEDPGLELSAEVVHRNREGKQLTFRIEAGWSLDQLLQLLLHSQEVATQGGDKKTTTAAGYFAPTHLKGELGTDQFRLSFGNDGHPSKYHCLATEVPGLPSVLGYVLDPSTIERARLHLELPDAGELANLVRKAVGGSFVTLGGCALELPAADDGEARFYEISISLRPHLLKAVLRLIPFAGQIYTVVSKAIDIVTDLPGTLESLAYSPEAALQILESAPELFDMVKEKGVKGIVLALVMNSDVSTKKAVLANRIAKLRKSLPSGWKKGDPKPGELANIPDEYLEWLAVQIEKHPDTFVKLDQLRARIGAEALSEDLDYSTQYDLPSADEIENKIIELEHGFTEFAKAREAAKTAQEPETAKRQLEAQAAALRRKMDKILRAGAKPSSTQIEGRGPGTSQPTEAGEREYSKVDDLPAPSAEQDALAMGMFQADDSGTVVVSAPESRYLVQKYATLTPEQLGDLLTAGVTTVETTNGTRRALPLLEEERAFVRELFVRHATDKGIRIAVSAPGSEPDDDHKLVAAYHSSELTAARQSARRGGDELADALTDRFDDEDALSHDDQGSEPPGTRDQGSVSDGDHEGPQGGHTAAKNGNASSESSTGSRSGEPENAPRELKTTIDADIANKLVRWDEHTQRVVLDATKVAMLKRDWNSPEFRNEWMPIETIELHNREPEGTLKPYTLEVTYRTIRVGPDQKHHFELTKRAFNYYLDTEKSQSRTLVRSSNEEYLEKLRELGTQIGEDARAFAGKRIVTSGWTMIIERAEPPLKTMNSMRVATAYVTFTNVKASDVRMMNTQGEWFVISDKMRQQVYLPLPKEGTSE